MSTTRIIIYAVIAIIVIAIIYYLYKHYNKTKIAYYDSATVVEDKHSAKKHKSVRGTLIPPPLQGNEYAISMWVYLNDYNYRYGQTKHVLYRGIEKEGTVEANPHIFLHPTESTMMFRFKLQSDTVPDPKSHLKKITVADSVNGQEIVNTATNNTVNNEDRSNVSGNNVGNSGNNGVVDDTNSNVNPTVEEFYSELGSNIIDDSINYDQMTHNYGIVGEGCVATHKQQIKELFEDVPPNNVPADNEQPGNTAEESVVNNETSNNALALNNMASGNNTTDPVTSPLSQEFIDNNPFIASFMDKYSKAASPEERQSVANEYASNFVDKNEDERKEIADQFMVTLARMFATTMGLTVINEKEYSQEELDEAKRQEQLFDTCYVRNIPMQKWTNITLSVYQNTVDIYIDGKLTSSCNLKGFPRPNKNDLLIAPLEGFDGYISNTKFFNMAFTPEKAMELYKEGPAFNRGFFGSLWASLGWK